MAVDSGGGWRRRWQCTPSPSPQARPTHQARTDQISGRERLETGRRLPIMYLSRGRCRRETRRRLPGRAGRAETGWSKPMRGPSEPMRGPGWADLGGGPGWRQGLAGWQSRVVDRREVILCCTIVIRQTATRWHRYHIQPGLAVDLLSLYQLKTPQMLVIEVAFKSTMLISKQNCSLLMQKLMAAY